MKIEEIDIQYTEFQFSSVWAQKFIKLRNDLETFEKEALSDIIIQNAYDKIMANRNLIPDM